MRLPARGLEGSGILYRVIPVVQDNNEKKQLIFHIEYLQELEQTDFKKHY